MAQNVTVAGASYSNVPSVNLPKTGGGTAIFTDTSDANATAADIISGKTAYVNGVKLTGTASSGGGTAIVVTEEPDTGGGVTKLITAVDLASDTVDAAHLISGYTAHDRLGTAIVGTASSGSSPTLLATKSLGSISTSSTSATNTGQTVTVNSASSYDLLIVSTSCTKTNSRHWATIGLIELYNSSNATAPNTVSISTNKYNYKVVNNVVQSRCGTTAYGIYPYSCSMSDGDATITMYQRYNSTSTGTINGSYTTKVYGVKLYSLL